MKKQWSIPLMEISTWSKWSNLLSLDANLCDSWWPTDLPEVHSFGPGAVVGIWNILPHEFSHPAR